MIAMPRLWRALRQLFHQMTGMLFFCLAAFGAFAALGQWRNPAARWVAWLGIGYALLMVGFGVAALRDAHRLR